MYLSVQPSITAGALHPQAEHLLAPIVARPEEQLAEESRPTDEGGAAAAPSSCCDCVNKNR